MSAAQHQALVLGNVSFVAFVFGICFVLSPGRTKFNVFAACNLVFVAAMFYAVALLDLSGERTEVILSIMTELSVVLTVSWICLALVGGLSSHLGALPVEPVARRSWLREVLRSAPLFLLIFVGIAGVIGLVWPSPAMRVYAPAPPEFFVMKGLIMVPEGLYSGLAALTFVMAGRASGLKRRLYFKNLAFSLGMLCIGSIALESTIFAGFRVWASGESRRVILETLNALEMCLTISCILAFAAGLSLRYTPVVAGPLLHRLQTGWLHAQEQFESLEWRAVSVGAAARLTKASDAVVLACRLRNVSESDTEKALATMRLVAVMKDPSSETRHITPEAARKLYKLQKEILCDDALSSKISWAASLRSRAQEYQTVKSAPLHDALRAALDLIDHEGERSRIQTRPLWHWIVAVSAADAKIIDLHPSKGERRLDEQDEYRTAVEVCSDAKTFLQLSETGD
ncbi:hypothetical protein BH18ACT11_BH18ACT11_10470 [soil metagenome]